MIKNFEHALTFTLVSFLRVFSNLWNFYHAFAFLLSIKIKKSTNQLH